MSGKIYLYGKGDTAGSGDKDRCYFQCAIPDQSARETNGYLPSVLHSYMMYAKDIGLIVSDIIYEDESEINRELSYSFWPLVYVDNSEIFTDEERTGIAVWQKSNDELTYQYSVVLDEQLAFYFKSIHSKAPQEPNLNPAQKAANPEPAPNNAVISETAWYLDLTLPNKADKDNKASTYSIVRHYNEYIVLDTLLDMSVKVSNVTRCLGLKQATGIALQAVTDRMYAYDAIMPSWSRSWGTKPDWYDNERKSLNNYNISASLFTYGTNEDPDSAYTEMELFATASNIKGLIKSGHAETRLLLTIDVLNHTRTHAQWFGEVTTYYEFNAPQDMVRIIKFYENKYLTLISSLKPCYLCVGETDASSDGFIKTIDGKRVEMWACYEGTAISKVIQHVVYFDIDRPIVYPSDIQVSIYEDGIKEFEWSLLLARWSEWSAVCNTIDDTTLKFTTPIGPRIVEPAGECLKTGYAYTRYKNSAYLLLTDGRTYKRELEYQTRGYSSETQVD